MGAAKNRREAFLRKHPRCAFCGGEKPATTIEHCPPRALFQYRQWPEGFEFPSCPSCNLGTSNHDLLVAMLARMDPIEESGNTDGRLVGLMKNANAQYPDLFAKMMPSAVEARRLNKTIGLEPSPGLTQQEAGLIKVTDEHHQAVCSLARKLAKAIFYQTTERTFPNEGCLLLNWFTNADFLRDGKYVVFDLLKNLTGLAPPLQRSGKYLNNQFEYKFSLSSDMQLLVLQARFGSAFGLVVFGNTLPGKLESIVERIREQTNRYGPFAVLQSTTLK